MHYDTRFRSISKAVSWRFWATIITALLVFVFTGKIAIAVAIGGVEVIVKMLFYFLHERLWNKIGVGKKKAEPFVLWFTGLSGSGKSTLADSFYKYLLRKGHNVERLDGDTVRSIFPNTGFSKEERDNHIKKVGFLASTLEKNGVSVISSFVSPYGEARDFVRGKCKNFIEVYVCTPLEVCEQRDPKGLYKKVRNGQIKSFTGIDAPYEAPKKPEIVINTDKQSVEESLAVVKKHIRKYISTF